MDAERYIIQICKWIKPCIIQAEIHETIFFFLFLVDIFIPRCDLSIMRLHGRIDMSWRVSIYVVLFIH